MAAYAALVSLMHVIHDIQNHHSPPIYLDKQQLQSLIDKVSFLQGILESYTSPFSDIDDQADPLEIRIAEAAYAAEDVIESHIVNVIKLGISTTTTSTDSRGEGTTSFSTEEVNCGEEVSCISLYEDLHQVIEEMDLIKLLAMDMDTEKAVSATVVSQTSSSSSTRHNTTSMVCSEDVLLGIMEKLVEGRHDRQVIPIVGMGGIGKTTLARNIYVHPLIKAHFDFCAWATISQQFNTREIVCELLSRKEERNERSSDDKIALELYQFLFGRRFLIVLDDMWSIDAWDKIHSFFPDNDNGSRILVTTRLSQLSSQLNYHYSFQMKFLDEISSWDLFSKIVFGEESCPFELVEIGKEIAKNCRGLPLSIVVVGGLLKKTEHTLGCWESIRSDFTSSIVNLENDKHCLRLFQMSYDHLPVYLKPCFLYMGVFEEDYKIRVSRLIKLWISEGFLKPMNDKSLRTIAKGFLKDLVDRNLILIDEFGSTGDIKYCKIHDLLRDLCIRESRKYGFYHVIGQGGPQGIHSQRRVVISASTSKKKVVDALISMSRTRSLLCENGRVPPCWYFELLRTLEASRNHSNQSYVRHFMSKCVNLRHLVVQSYSMSSCLFSLNLMWNLHTLIVYCLVECDVPVVIWKMPQFRHIEFTFKLLCLPDPPSDGQDGVVVMENLEILKGVKNFKCGDDVVRRIPNVKKLGIRYCNYDDDYCLSNIKCLLKLESLDIFCDKNIRGVVDSPLYKLTFPHSLKNMTLCMNSEFEWEEILEKIGSLPLVQKLKLWGGCFRTEKWEILEDEFPCLRYLSLRWCGGLKHWTADQESTSILPRLEHLRLFEMKELKEIPSEIGGDECETDSGGASEITRRTTSLPFSC